MNPLTTYEIEIAEKVATLPVPDLADQIWAAIEQELDLDAPSNDGEPGGNQPTPKPTSPTPVPMPYLIIIATAAIIAIAFGLYKVTRQPNTMPATPTPIPAQAPPGSNLPPDNSSTIPLPESKGTGVTVKNSPLQTPRTPQDVSIPLPDMSQQAISLTLADSSGNQAVSPLIKSAQSPDSITVPQIPPKRPRGVSNISDSDYKLIGVRKDSGKGK